MRLIINIPHEVYEDIRDNYEGNEVVYTGVKYGEPELPHGEEPELPHGEWIPCSERVPDKNGVYLVTGANGHVFEYDYSDFTTHNEKWSYCGNEIVAWMPLPEPYKREGDEK